MSGASRWLAACAADPHDNATAASKEAIVRGNGFMARLLVELRCTTSTCAPAPTDQRCSAAARASRLQRGRQPGLPAHGIDYRPQEVVRAGSRAGCNAMAGFRRGQLG